MTEQTATNTMTTMGAPRAKDGMGSHAGDADRAERSSKTLLVVMYGVAFVAAFNENIINVALLDISNALAVSTATAQWLITGYMIVTSIITATMGYLSRRFSMRRLFFVATGCLLVGEIGCLVAPTFGMLLPFRLIQAIGSGIAFPLMMNTVLAVAPKRRIGFFMSLGGACITLGPAFGPVISGLMVTLLGWRGIFVFPAVAIAAFLLAGIAVVRNLAEPTDVSLDGISVVLLALGLTALVFGLGEIMSDLPVALAAIAVAAIAIAVFAVRQLKLETPLLDIRPFANPGFWPAILLEVVAMMTTFSMSVLLPLYFEGSFGMSALVAGLLILPAIAVNAVTSIVGGRIMDGHGEWPLLPIGFALVLVGLAGVAAVAGSLQLVAVVALSVVVYAGVGLVLSPSQTAGLRTLSREQNASGTAIVNTFVMIAASIGPSLFIGVMSAQTNTALGFADAVRLAAVIACCGLAISVVYALRQRKVRDAR